MIDVVEAWLKSPAVIEDPDGKEVDDAVFLSSFIPRSLRDVDPSDILESAPFSTLELNPIVIESRPPSPQAEGEHAVDEAAEVAAGRRYGGEAGTLVDREEAGGLEGGGDASLFGCGADLHQDAVERVKAALAVSSFMCALNSILRLK